MYSPIKEENLVHFSPEPKVPQTHVSYTPKIMLHPPFHSLVSKLCKVVILLKLCYYVGENSCSSIHLRIVISFLIRNEEIGDRKYVVSAKHELLKRYSLTCLV